MFSTIPNDIDAALTRLKEDNSSGAHALTISVCELLNSLIAELPPDATDGDILEIVARIGRQIVKAHPAIAPLRRLLYILVKKLEGAPTSSDLRKISGQWIEVTLEWLREIRFRIAGHAAMIIADRQRILTHSFSTLVVEALREARRQSKTLEVVVTESRPVYEGRILSRQLSLFEIPVKMIVDAAAAGYVEKCDLVLLGADRLTSSEFINKVGSFSIVLAAHRANIPCYVLAGSDKYLPESIEPVTLEGRKLSDVWDEAPMGVDIDNVYFERVPLRLVTGIISEIGITSFGQYSRQTGSFFEGRLAKVD